MTDPYAETDDWPTVPATRPHSHAQPRSGVGTSPSTPEASAGVHGAQGAREASYAEAIAAQQLSDHPEGFTDLARAADRAEIERLRSPACAECGALPVTCAAAPIKCCPDCSGPTHQAAAAGRRLACAEAERDRLREAVRRVEALLACQSTGCPCGGDRASVPSRDVRAVLADAATDPTPSTGECSTCGRPMDTPPCSKSGSLSGHTIAGGLRAASSADDKEGEQR